jgi:peptidoglycan-associated lipoprotein
MPLNIYKMKSAKFANLLVFGLVLTVAFTGCRKHVGMLTPMNGPKSPLVGEADNAGKINANNTADATSSTVNPDTTSGIPANAAGSHQGWNEDANALKSDAVYFDYDSATLKASEQSKVSAVVDYLKSNASAAVRVEGNCDERGTEEYNRALGDRRANALREALAKSGIEPSRVDTLSNGEDKPADPGHNEAAWHKNRRDDFIVLTPPK